MTNLFFVYGTLKKGESNHKLLGSSKYIGKALTLVNYYAYHSGFPMIKYSDNGLPMLGELYQVESPKVISELDRLEGNGSFYTRVIRPVKILDFFEEKVNAWIYEIPDAPNYAATYCPINEQYNAHYWSRHP